MQNDWDKPDEDEEPDSGDESDVEDFESLNNVGGLADSDEEILEMSSDNEDDEDEVKLSGPPSENEALRMMKTFNSIYETSQELAATMNVVIANARMIISLSQKSGLDVEKIVENYNGAVLKINKQLSVAQKYFELNKKIAEELSFMKDELREEFKDLNSTIEIAQKEYIEGISSSIKNLSLKLSDFSQSMDFSAFEKVVKQEIEKVIKSSSIDRVQAAFDSVDKSFFLLEESVIRLVGADKKKGLLEEFREEVYLLEGKIKKIKLHSNISGISAAFLVGACLSGAAVWFQLSVSFDKRLSLSLAEHTVNVNEAWVKKNEVLGSAHKGYDAFVKRFGINDKNGFGYFDDTKKPYFYYDAAKKVIQVRDKIYVELE